MKTKAHHVTRNELLSIAARLLAHPSIAYHEHAVRTEVESILDEHAIQHERDAFGNVIARAGTGSSGRILALSAHMDHPGFEIIEHCCDQSWIARFRGGVPENYFRAGTKVRLLPGNTGALLEQKAKGEKTYRLKSQKPAKVRPEFAVWDLPAFRNQKGRIYARACDDLIGVACIIATLIEISRSNAKARMLGLITRAEEVGFHGALSVASRKRIPSDAFVISLETSKEMPDTTMGRGVILRVGDKASTFSPKAARFMRELAEDVKATRQGFQFQRALMSGGTCEATAYQEFGFETAAVCVALGNYHNCGPKEQIRAEYVDAEDAFSMTQLMIQAAMRLKDYDSLTSRLEKRLQDLLKEAQQEISRRER